MDEEDRMAMGKFSTDWTNRSSPANFQSVVSILCWDLSISLNSWCATIKSEPRVVSKAQKRGKRWIIPIFLNLSLHRSLWLSSAVSHDMGWNDKSSSMKLIFPYVNLIGPLSGSYHVVWGGFKWLWKTVNKSEPGCNSLSGQELQHLSLDNITD